MEVSTLIMSVVGVKLKALFENIVNDFSDDIKHIATNNILEYQVDEYNRNLSSKTLLHRVQPKALKDFYQPLFIRSCKRRQRSSNTNSNDRISTNSIKNLFAKKKFITLIGNAGSGKSTIVKYLFLNSIDTDYKIPIKVELRYLNDFKGTLNDFIKDRIFKFNRLAHSDKIIEKMLSSGNLIFFLDGYDEIVSSKKEKITKEIDELVQVYNKNNYLLTTRPYTEIELLPMFHNFEVCELSDIDIDQFIGKQIPQEENELRDKLIEAVHNKENESYKSFLSNPLLLSMFILTFQSYSSIPQKRSEFYSQVFDALFSVHDSMSKLAFVREKQSGLSKEQLIEVLKLFSFISYFDEQFIFSGIYLNQKLTFIKEKKNKIDFDNSKLISDLQIAIGILNKEGTDYTFPHRSLQEYFAAIYIVSLDNQNKVIVYNKIMDSLTNDKKFSHTAQDNFHLLLSELDPKNVTEYGLLPYFDNFISEFKDDETDQNKIISNFLNLDRIYQSFNVILRSETTSIANDDFNTKFRSYRSENDNKKGTLADMEKDREVRLQRLSKEEIQPFLISFLPSLKFKRDELKNYLINENNSDKDIIMIMK